MLHTDGSPLGAPAVTLTGGAEQLSCGVALADGFATVRFAGELNSGAVARFQDMMEEASSYATPLLIVDLGDLTSMDARAVKVLVAAGRRSRLLGRRMEVHRLPAASLELIHQTGFATDLDIVPSAPDPVSQGITVVLRSAFAQDTLVAALNLVVKMAQAVVIGADSVSITLPRHGQLRTVAASDHDVLNIDHDQYETGEGPSLDAAHQGKPFQIESLASEDRWPRFIPRAQARGINSILSTPLLSGVEPVGALNVYSRRTGAFPVQDKKWTDRLAAEASVVISSAQVGVTTQDWNIEIEQALGSREVIAMAQGILMHRDEISPGAAYARLREHSRQSNQPLRDVCQDLVTASGTAVADAVTAKSPNVSSHDRSAP